MKFTGNIFEEDYITSFVHTGIHDTLTNKSFLSLMENLAGAHSSACHLSFAELANDNLTWLLINWKLKVINRPKADEKIKLQTWIRSSNKLFVFRDFKMFDSDGNLCAVATSKWCLFNYALGKIAPMPTNIVETYNGQDESVFDVNDLPRLKEPALTPINADTYKIRRFDLDLNNHVHNLNYLNYAYELLPMDIFEGDELNNVEIYYKKEIKYGETIKSFLYQENNIYTIAIKSEDEKVLHSVIKLYN